MELWDRGSDATLQTNQRLLFHGHLFIYQERRQVIAWQHLLPTVCHRQGLRVCHAHAQQVRSPTSSQVVCKGSCSRCNHFGYVWRTDIQRSQKVFAEIGTTLKFFEEGTPRSNKAELYIGLIKEAVCKDMRVSNCPLVFWDYCVERRLRINNLTARDTVKLRGSNPHTFLTGEEGDISNLCQFGFYNWCYYHEQGEAFPYSKEILGRVLGPSKGEGNEMAQWILKANGNDVYTGGLPDPSPWQNCTHLRSSRSVQSSISSLRGDGVVQSSHRNWKTTPRSGQNMRTMWKNLGWY